MRNPNNDGMRTAAFWRGKAGEASALAERVLGREGQVAAKNMARAYKVMANRAEAREIKFARLVGIEERAKKAPQLCRSRSSLTIR